MNKKIFKIIGIVATVLGAACTLVGEFVSKKQTEDFIIQEIEKRL